MEFKEINKKFTEKVAEYMAQGWYLNSATMSGSQGEISKVDLTNGKDIVRVMLHTVFGKQIENTWHLFEYVELIVGKVPESEAVPPNSPDTFGNTIWDDKLEVIYSECFYEIGRRRHRHKCWYGNLDEAIAQNKKANARFKARCVSNVKQFSDEAKKIVLPFICRKPMRKRPKISDVEKVEKHVYRNLMGDVTNVNYEVTVWGRVYILG